MDLFNLALESTSKVERMFLSAKTPAQRELVVAMNKGTVSLEETSDGKPFNEIEHVIYGRITDFNQLKEASSMETQEQWEVRIPKTDKNAGKGSIRVRKTTIAGGDPVYVVTTKIPTNGEGDKLELALPSNEDNFLQFKYLAEQGMVKNRYHFPIVGTDMVWEVDVFPKEGGGYHEWCKIDLEVKNRETPIPELPLVLENIILPEGFGRQDSEKAAALITQIYEKCFITQNEFLNKTIKPEDGTPDVHTGTEETGEQPVAPAADTVGDPDAAPQSSNEVPENMNAPDADLDPNLAEKP
jgi:hypothetical protein